MLAVRERYLESPVVPVSMTNDKSEVKSLMEKFNKGNSCTEDNPFGSRNFRVPGKLELQTRKAIFEKCANQENAPPSSSGPSTSQETVYPKPSLGVKSSTDHKTEENPEASYLKTVAQKFGVQLQATNRENDEKSGCSKPPTKTNDLAKEDTQPLYPKSAGNKLLNCASNEKEKSLLGARSKTNFPPQESEAKPMFSKVTAVKEKLMSATQANEPKPSFSKPPLAQKCSLTHEVSHSEDASTKNVFLQKRLSGPRPNIHSFKAGKETDKNTESAAEAAGSHFSSMALKPTGRWPSSSQGTSKNTEEKSEEKEMNAAKNIFLNKTIQEEPDSSVPKFHKVNTGRVAGLPSGVSAEKQRKDGSSGIPRRKTLPSLFKLSQAPQKPNRPPCVELGKFQKSGPKKNRKIEELKQGAPSSAAVFPSVPLPHSAGQLPPPPPASRPCLPSSAAPTLPARNIKPSPETISPDNEENYDDVEFVSRGKMHTFYLIGQESDGEMYEDISDIRSPRGKEKWAKEEKRRMDQDKKVQKEKEKKENEIRKKFKLTGPIQVLHRARACIDYRGGKNELTVRQGDEIEIIRLTDNPEGKWLGRIKGSYGYIKITIVEIDYDSLRRKQQPSTRAAVNHPENSQEVYDDVGEQDIICSQSGGQSGAGQMFPPPPSDQEICNAIDYEDAAARSVSQDEDKNDIWSWGILKRLKVKDVKKKSVREKTTQVNGAEDNGDMFSSLPTKHFEKDCGEDVYDDVDSSDYPPPPPEPQQAKMGITPLIRNLEEKEFRKKFKFDGEIKVLYSTTTIQDLPQRRWGSKDLQVKAGESLEIIESTDDTKVLCRNEEGKYGYVLRSNLVENEGVIYDDVCDDCIYDNE
ncbi:PREDICTED: FYN-binding protein [Apaloderma vittatum]|uniref:FYN-binding protein n=1 Tax=Apaloderma vittatum TaxID=57397 RepID=UPI0005216751|nr:PREDICTED: FYN-binding protein [Apaloderma vittatum]